MIIIVVIAIIIETQYVYMLMTKKRAQAGWYRCPLVENELQLEGGMECEIIE